MEELFLRLRLAGEEVNVVDQEEIALLAVAAAEIVHPLVLKRLHELVHEALGADVDDARARSLFAHAVREGVDEVRLAEARTAADEERVVTAPSDACRRHRRGVRELVGRPDDEVGERVLRVEPLDGLRDGDDARDLRYDGVHARLPILRAASGLAAGNASVALFRSPGAHREGARPHGRKRRRAIRDGVIEAAVDDPAHLDAEPRVLTKTIGHRGQEIVFHPAANELVASAKAQHAVRQAVELNAREPLVEARGRLLAREPNGLGPRMLRFARHDRLLCNRRCSGHTALLMALHPRLHHFPRRQFRR